MDKRQSKIIIVVCFFVSAIIVIFTLRAKPAVSVQTPDIPLSTSTPVPPPAIPVVEAAQPAELTSVEASDGNMVLNMKQENGKDTVTYTFLMTDETTGIQKEIFTKTEPIGTTLSVPANTFSSDDKYIFLKETGPSATDYFVLTSSGAPINQTSQTLDVSGPFVLKYPNYVITDITGWAGPTLLVVNVNKASGAIGPSFWYDVSSHGFILLSDRFN
jgi:hypothetical protein